jgi:hypothetical protein
MKNDVCIFKILDNYSLTAVESVAFALEIARQKPDLNLGAAFSAASAIFPRIVRSLDVNCDQVDPSHLVGHGAPDPCGSRPSNQRN